MKRSNRKSEIGETAIKGRTYEKNPARRESIKSAFNNLDPDEIYDSSLLHQMRRASGRS